MSRKHRLIFRPLEKLQIQRIGSISVEEVTLDDELDRKFKPGLYLQVKAFIEGGKSGLAGISEQSANAVYYRMIGGGQSE